MKRTEYLSQFKKCPKCGGKWRYYHGLGLTDELEKFCKWLEETCYLDDDWRHEKPTAIERYMEETK